MTSQNLMSLLPLLVVLSTSIVVMLAIAWRRSHPLVAALSIGGLALALLSTLVQANAEAVSGLLIVDSYANFLIQLLLLTTLIIFIFTYEHIKNNSELPEELYLLLLLSTNGALVMVASNHFVSFFLGLELLTIPLYGAISYTTHNAKSLEAGVKYIILAGLAAAMLLFGMALMYASLGTMNFDLMIHKLGGSAHITPPLFLAGLALLIAAVGFKISAIPFHLWTPDIYDGAPLPATAFLATVSKAASLALFLRLWILLRPTLGPEVYWLLATLAMLSMVGGNLLALRQENIKRLLGYSSIAQFGYLTMAVIATGAIATQAVLLNLLAYIVTILLVFGVLMSLDAPIEKIADLKGLFRKRPVVALMLMLGFLSLMGLPLTALFMAKFLVIMAGVQSAQWLLVVSLVVGSAIGIFVYLRVINILFDQAQQTPERKSPLLKPLVSSTLVLLALCLVVLGIWPTPATEHIRASNLQSLLSK